METEVIPLKRGAKLHKKNKSKKWQPKKWEPMYDQMVALSCTGMSNTAIAKRFGYTPQQVCNILTSDNGKIIKGLVTKHIQENLILDAKTRFAQNENRAIEIVHEVLHNTDLLEKAPMAMYDRAIKFLEGRGTLESEEKKQAQRNPMIPAELVNKLIAGIALSNEAAKLHNAVEVRTLPDVTDRRGTSDRKVS